MFDKFQQAKQLWDLRNQAQQLQKQLEQVEHTEEKNGILVKVDGTQKIKYLEINGEERNDLVIVINNAMKEVQKKSAKKMMEAGGGLSGLLGGIGK
ncbi:MAG: YbaB/EbfC family nucleoid-associated protein [Patescibacteria group bacterium]|nr:YbaB/EbfC family nucleoid-associated protein [Patescibacteria group bacterium]